MLIPLVARAGVLAEVDSALAATRAGRGTLLTVTGEPGIGAAVRGPVHRHLALLADALGEHEAAAGHRAAAVAEARALGAAALAARIEAEAPPAWRAVPDVDASQMDVLAGKLIRFLETGDAPEGLFRPDVFLDLTMPTWRIQAAGAEDLIAERKQGHPGPGTVTRWRADPTPDGFVLEFEERRDSGGQQWYAREMMRIAVTEGAIAEVTVYCTGDWDQARQAEHAAAVTLIRP